MFTYSLMKLLKLGAFYLLLGTTLQSCFCMPIFENCDYQLGRTEEEKQNSSSYHLAPQKKDKSKPFIKGVPTVEAGASINFRSRGGASTPYNTYTDKAGMGFSLTVGREMYFNRELVFHPALGVKSSSYGDETSIYVPGDDFTASLDNTYKFTQITAPLQVEYRMLNGQL